MSRFTVCLLKNTCPFWSIWELTPKEMHFQAPSPINCCATVKWHPAPATDCDTHPGSTPFSVPPARLLDWYLGPLKVNHASILSSTVQIFFYLRVWCVWHVCVYTHKYVCVHVCYGACMVHVREQPRVLVLSFRLARVRVPCSPTINTRLTGLNCYASCLCLPSLCGRIRCVLQIQTQALTLLRQALCPLNHLPSPV